MARFHIGVESALDPFTATALRELPDHYHVCVGFNVPRTTRMAEALILRLAGEQSALFMVGTLHVDAPLRGNAHGPWEIYIEEGRDGYWEPYDTPLGDTNPLLGLQYTANKAQDWIAANLPALEDPLHPWHADVRPQVFPRLLIVTEHPVDVERHSWVWYFSDAQQLIEHLEAWRPRDPFPITPAVLRNLVAAFGLEPEEPWDERPVDISAEALRDIQREWTALGEEIRGLRGLLTDAQEALGAIRSRGRQIDEALRHLARGIETGAATRSTHADDDYDEDLDDDRTSTRSRDEDDDEIDDAPKPRKRAAKAAAPEVIEATVDAPAKRSRAKAKEEPVAVDDDDDDDGGDDAPPEPPRRGRPRKAEATPEPVAEVAAPVRTRRRAATTDEVDAEIEAERAAEIVAVAEPPTIRRLSSRKPMWDPDDSEADESNEIDAPKQATVIRQASTPASPRGAAADAAGLMAATVSDLEDEIKIEKDNDKLKSKPADANTQDEQGQEQEDEPIDFAAYGPTMPTMFRRSPTQGGSMADGPRRFRGALAQRPSGVITGKEPLRLLPAAIRGLPHSPTSRTAARIEAAFKRTMPHFALGPFGYPSFEAFLLTAIEASVIRGEGGTYWLPEEGPLPPAPEAAAAGPGRPRGASPQEQAIDNFLSLPESQQRWLVQQMSEIEGRAKFLTQRYLARGLTYGRPPIPLTEIEAEELVFASRKLRLLNEIESPFDEGPRFTLRLNRENPFVQAALSGAPLPDLEPVESGAERM